MGKMYETKESNDYLKHRRCAINNNNFSRKCNIFDFQNMKFKKIFFRFQTEKQSM